MEYIIIPTIIGLVVLEYYLLYQVRYKQHYGPIGSWFKQVYIKLKYRRFV